MPMNDPYSKKTPGPIDPATSVVLLTPSDDDELDFAVRILRVFVPGTVAVIVKVQTVAGDDAELTFPPGLSIENLRIRKLYATGTDADTIVHGYFDKSYAQPNFD